MTPLLLLLALGAPTSTTSVQRDAEQLHQESDDFVPGRGTRSADDTDATPVASPTRTDQPGGPSAAPPLAEPAVKPPEPQGIHPAGPSPSLDVPTSSKDVPNINSGVIQSSQTKAYLRTEGQRQVDNGKLMLWIGVPMAVVGTILGVGGMLTVSNGRNPGGSAAAILGGMALSAAGGGGIIAGSVLLHRGRKKLDRGQERAAPQVALSFRF